MTRENYGRFTVSDDMVLNNPEGVSEVFRQMKFVPTRCEMIAHSKSFEYYGLSCMFRELPYNDRTPVVIPKYDIIITRAKDGSTSVSVEEVK